MTKELPQVTRIYQFHSMDSTRWQNYQPRPDDIVISTSLKSGTTFTKGAKTFFFKGANGH